LNWCAWFLCMKKPGEKHKRPDVDKHVPPSVGGTSKGSINLCASPHAHGSLGKEAELPGGVGAGAVGTGGIMAPLPPEIQQILEEVSYIAQRFRHQDEAEAICSEWKFVAAVVDRLCLVAFSLFNIICTFTILLSAPNFIEAVSKDRRAGGGG